MPFPIIAKTEKFAKFKKFMLREFSFCGSGKMSRKPDYKICKESSLLCFTRQGNWDRTAGTGQPIQDNLDRTAMERTARA
jgi:hypothetical protein